MAEYAECEDLAMRLRSSNKEYLLDLRLQRPRIRAWFDLGKISLSNHSKG